jgi:small subunit ribosomal protein S17
MSHRANHQYSYKKPAPPKHYKKTAKHDTYALPSPNTRMKSRAQRPHQILFEENRENKSNIRSFLGRVFSNRMDKTATVLVPRMRFNKHIGKHFREHKKFKAHDEHNECNIGDLVRIHFDRKRSKTKSWLVTEIVNSNRSGYEALWPIERAPPSITPERALTPQVYLDHDVYRDDVTGLKMPYISDFVMSSEGRGPIAIKPEPVGKRQFHPYDDHFARVKIPIMQQVTEANEKAAEIQAKLKAERSGTQDAV